MWLSAQGSPRRRNPLSCPRVWWLKSIMLAMAAVAIAAPYVFGQGVSVNVRADQTQITVGDRINLEVVITADTTLSVVLPATEDALGVFEIKDFRRFDPTVDKSGQRVYRSQFNMTTWTTGRWVVPPLVVTYTDRAGHSGSASSDSLFIDVQSILGEAGADTVDIRDLKPPYSVPVSRAIYYYLAAAIILIALAIWFFFRRRRKKEMIAGDTRTPWERAFDELTELKNSNCLGEEKWREWYFALTEIFRRYLDGRYGVETLEATTTEVKSILPGLPFTEAERHTITDFLEFAGLVKFAKLVPPPARPESDFDWVWGFVERTRIQTLIQGEPATGAEKTGTAG